LASAARPRSYYLPLTLCERLGYFKEQGLDVTINDFRAAHSRCRRWSAARLRGHRRYEHTIACRPRARTIQALIELGRFPRHRRRAAEGEGRELQVRGDLKGMKIGVTRARLLTNFFSCI